MRNLFIIVLLMIILTTAGCTTIKDNKNLKINESAVFDSFTASIDHISIERAERCIDRLGKPICDVYEIKWYITVKNTGNNVLDVMAYSGLEDYAGGGNNGGVGLLFGKDGGGLYPGETSTGNDITYTKSDSNYQALLKGATLHVEFHDLDNHKFDASWIIDFNNLPA
jgi:hypothetical protein